MALKQGDLSINGTPVAYEGSVKVKAGSLKRTAFPQVNGPKIVVSSVESNLSMITVTIRVTPDSNDQFDAFFDNSDNNTIIFREDNFVACFIEELPERSDLETVDYVFYGDPKI